MKFCFKDTKGNQYRTELLPAMKIGFIVRILNGKNHVFIWDNHQLRLKTSRFRQEDHPDPQDNCKRNCFRIQSNY